MASRSTTLSRCVRLAAAVGVLLATGCEEPFRPFQPDVHSVVVTATGVSQVTFNETTPSGDLRVRNGTPVTFLFRNGEGAQDPFVHFTGDYQVRVEFGENHLGLAFTRDPADPFRGTFSATGASPDPIQVTFLLWNIDENRSRGDWTTGLIVQSSGGG